jgi:hypothetical protein
VICPADVPISSDDQVKTTIATRSILGSSRCQGIGVSALSLSSKSPQTSASRRPSGQFLVSQASVHCAEHAVELGQLGHLGSKARAPKLLQASLLVLLVAPDDGALHEREHQALADGHVGLHLAGRARRQRALVGQVERWLFT